MSIKINKISFDENNIINKKDCFITPAKKEDLKRLIIQYNMKVKEQKGNISNNNNEKNDIVLNYGKEKENKLNLMIPFFKYIPRKRNIKNDLFKDVKYFQGKINKFLSKSINKSSHNKDILMNSNNSNKISFHSYHKRNLTNSLIKNNETHIFPTKLKNKYNRFSDMSFSMTNSFNNLESFKKKIVIKMSPKKIKNNSVNQINPKDYFEEKLYKIKIKEKKSQSSSLIKKIEISNILPFAPIFKNSFISHSEKERYEKNCKMLYHLYYFINKNPNNKNKIVTDFFKQKLILEPEYYSTENLNKFINYLNNNIKEIDFRLPLINIIKSALDISFEKNENINYNQSMKCLFPYKKSFDFYSKRKSLRKIPQKLNLDKALLKQSNSLFSKESIKDYNNEQIKCLQKEIDSLQNNFENKNSFTSNLINRLYYKEKIHDKDKFLKEEKIEELAKKKHKLLEYIVLQNALDQINIRKDLDIE